MPMNGRAVETAMPGSSSRPLSPRSSTGSIRSISGGGAMRRRSRFTTVAALTAVAAVGPAAAIKTLAAGGDHACVITTTGGVKCWGQNSKGQLGYQDVVKRTAPPADYVDLGENRSAVSITAGDAHTCAVLDNGNLKCWGYGNYGQLGQGDTDSYGSTAWPMGGLPPVDLGTDPATSEVRKATKAAAGNEFTCVLTEDGQVGCFGRNDQGELGIEHSGDIGKVATDMGNSLEFVDFGADYTGRAVDISSGPCALFDDGGVKCWGNNLYGSTGVPGSVNIGLETGDMGDALPVIPLGSSAPAGPQLSATALSSGWRHSCAIVDDGSVLGDTGGQVKCWGKNTQGNLGVGHVHDLGNDEDELGNNLAFTDLGAVDAYRMDGGLDHTCAVLLDGTVKCWGKNFRGALGLGDFRTRGDSPGEMGADLPAVFLGEGRTAVEISCGNDFSCAVLDNGEVKCWGSGDNGKLGQGNSQQLGDGAGEMEALGAVDLGAGVLAAAPVLPTAAPTGAPTGSPTPSPTTSPTVDLPTPAPAAVIQQPEATTAPDGEQPVASATTAPAASIPSDDTSDRSISDSDAVSWNLAAVYIAAPIGAIALMAGGFAFYKHNSGSTSA